MKKTISAIRDKVCRIDVDADGGERLFFENARGVFTFEISS